MQKLTRAEEELMQVLWGIEKGFLKDIMEAFPSPKPSQSTVSTILRILESRTSSDTPPLTPIPVAIPIQEQYAEFGLKAISS